MLDYLRMFYAKTLEQKIWQSMHNFWLINFKLWIYIWPDIFSDNLFVRSKASFLYFFEKFIKFVHEITQDCFLNLTRVTPLKWQLDTKEIPPIKKKMVHQPFLFLFIMKFNNVNGSTKYHELFKKRNLW